MTIEQLYEIILRQQEEIEKLTTDFKALKEWSDLNDYWLREMIDALTDSVDDLMDLDPKMIDIMAQKCYDGEIKGHQLYFFGKCKCCKDKKEC